MRTDGLSVELIGEPNALSGRELAQGRSCVFHTTLESPIQTMASGVRRQSHHPSSDNTSSAALQRFWSSRRVVQWICVRNTAIAMCSFFKRWPMTPGNFYTISLMKMKVKTVIKTFPSSLSHVDNDGRFPIHLAAFFSQSVAFVPSLAEIRCQVRGWRQRQTRRTGIRLHRRTIQRTSSSTRLWTNWRFCCDAQGRDETLPGASRSRIPKEQYGKTACEVAFEHYGKDETFKVIQECIPAYANYPVLHHVIKHAPQYMNDFTMRYPSAIYLRW